MFTGGYPSKMMIFGEWVLRSIPTCSPSFLGRWLCLNKVDTPTLLSEVGGWLVYTGFFLGGLALS